MKVICTQENLKSGLLTVGRIISPSNTLPILNNILLKTENGLLKICSTNLEVAISTQVRCKIEEEGEITVFSKTITDLVANLPNHNLTLQTNSGELQIEAENYHTSVKTLPAEEFPLIPVVESSVSLALPAQELKKAIDQVGFAASTNQTQPEISGILLATQEQSLKLVATDRYRLAERKLTLENRAVTQQAIIPHKTILELARVVGGSSGDVEVSMNETQIAFSFGQTQIISRLIDGQYPDYQQIIPPSFSITVITAKTALVSALRAGGIFSQNNNSIKLLYDLGKQTMTVEAESAELGKSVVELPSQVEGDSGSLILNYHYLLDCLNNLDTENVILKIINDSSPSLIVPEGQNDYLYLVMPIKT